MKLAPLRDSRFKLSKGSVISFNLKTLALDVTITDPGLVHLAVVLAEPFNHTCTPTPHFGYDFSPL